jgi:hypothetical protein
MPKVSKSSATKGTDQGPVIERAGELDNYTASFVEFCQDVDGTPLMKGCVDDRCQCPHWGYVLKGKMTMRYPDHTEVYEAGDAYYCPPGHVPIKHEPGTEIVMFSPTGPLRETEAIMQNNMAAMMKR